MTLKKEYWQARPYIEFYYPDLAGVIYENPVIQALILNPDRINNGSLTRMIVEPEKFGVKIKQRGYKDGLYGFDVIDKDTGEVIEGPKHDNHPPQH